MTAGAPIRPAMPPGWVGQIDVAAASWFIARGELGASLYLRPGVHAAELRADLLEVIRALDAGRVDFAPLEPTDDTDEPAAHV